MADTRLVITEAGFLTEFLNQHTQRMERPFCFILGAGASRSSGIPTGGEMANVWLRELYEAENFEGFSLEEWATADRLGIRSFSLAKVANFYPQLYQRRYGDHDQSGYAFLESQMEGKEPSYGYSVLAYLLSETPHRVVVTTNFDNLVADALSIHSSRFPLVIGHDSLAEYAAVELRRPLVAKIHGALGFSPKNQPDDISQLPEGWRKALARILERYTPIVIGYGGNDGSLMGFLEGLQPHVPDRVFWCVRGSDQNAGDLLQQVPAAVRDYVRSRSGRFVPVRGFDELMAKLLTKLGERGAVPDLYERLKNRHRLREQNYDDQQRRLSEAADPVVVASAAKGASGAPPPASDPELKKAVSEIVESRKDKPWWAWVKEADAAPNPQETERIYKEGIEALPKNADLYRNFASFYRNTGDSPNADKYYKRSLELDPNEPLTHVAYANFLKAGKTPEDAESVYLRALEVRPEYVFALASYADFQERIRKDADRAEELYERALKVDPRDEYALDLYISFLRSMRGNQAKADKLQEVLNEVKRNNG